MIIINSLKRKKYVTYWSSAFNTTGSAIIATAIFAETKEYGVAVGIICIFFGSLLHKLSLL